MKSTLIILLSILGMLTAATGLFDSDFHVFAACISTVAILVHVWIYRNAFLQRFKGLGWRWMIIGAGTLTAIGITAID
jgi:hypothetical protein